MLQNRFGEPTPAWNMLAWSLPSRIAPGMARGGKSSNMKGVHVEAKVAKAGVRAGSKVAKARVRADSKDFVNLEISLMTKFLKKQKRLKMHF